MGINERKEREREEIRELILNAAREIFVEEGYEHTSMRKIAQKIEYSPGTIYHHFKDKSDLLLALHDEKGTCGLCIARCPAGSIGQSVAQRDKRACHLWAYEKIGGELGLKRFGWAGSYGCGLCQTDVPCEDRNPTES